MIDPPEKDNTIVILFVLHIHFYHDFKICEFYVVFRSIFKNSPKLYVSKTKSKYILQIDD